MINPYIIQIFFYKNNKLINCFTKYSSIEKKQNFRTYIITRQLARSLNGKSI
jgi:hypothetical protein